jgi:hypothetical protein
MEFLLIRYALNIAYTNRVPNLVKIKLKIENQNDNEFDAFGIDEDPQFIQCLLRDNHREYISKDTIAKISIQL